jgi:hypothetical protein
LTSGPAGVVARARYAGASLTATIGAAGRAAARGRYALAELAGLAGAALHAASAPAPAGACRVARLAGPAGTTARAAESAAGSAIENTFCPLVSGNGFPRVAGQDQEHGEDGASPVATLHDGTSGLAHLRLIKARSVPPGYP